MTFTRKFNTFGGTNINIYLGNKTQKSKIPTESQPLIGGAVEGDSDSERGDGSGDEGKGKGKGAGGSGNGSRPYQNLSGFPESTNDKKDIAPVVANLAAQHAEDDAKIDIIEGKLTKNWGKLYVELGTIKQDAEYTQQNKSELILLIQQIVAAALLQTI